MKMKMKMKMKISNLLWKLIGPSVVEWTTRAMATESQRVDRRIDLCAAGIKKLCNEKMEIDYD